MHEVDTDETDQQRELRLAMLEIEEVCSTRPVLLRDVLQWMREVQTRKEGLTGLTMRTLLVFGHGELQEEFDDGLKSIEEHCKRYPYRLEQGKDGEKVVTEPREISLTLKVTPIVTTVEHKVTGKKKGRGKHSLEITQYEIQGTVKSVKPHYRSRPVRALPRGGEIQFNPDAPDNPLQETMDFDEDHYDD